MMTLPGITLPRTALSIRSGRVSPAARRSHMAREPLIWLDDEAHRRLGAAEVDPRTLAAHERSPIPIFLFLNRTLTLFP